MIDRKPIEKCSGVVFAFVNSVVEELFDYIDLLKEFYPVRSPPGQPEAGRAAAAGA